MTSRTGTSSTTLFDSAAAVEENRTPGEGAISGQSGAQSKLPECSEASGILKATPSRNGTEGLATSAALNRWYGGSRGTRDQLLALQEAEAATRHNCLRGESARGSSK